MASTSALSVYLIFRLFSALREEVVMRPPSLFRLPRQRGLILQLISAALEMLSVPFSRLGEAAGRPAAPHNH